MRRGLRRRVGGVCLGCQLAVVVWSGALPSAHAVTAERLGQPIDRSLDGLLARQTPWGGFDDPLAGPRFNYGAVALGWRAAARAAPGPAGEARRRAAGVTLRAGTRVSQPGAFQMSIEALAMTPPDAQMLDAPTRDALARHLEAYVAPAVGPGARTCKDDRRCYGNLKLVDAVGSLQLVRTGVRSPVPGARLADPEALDRRARAVVSVQVPGAQRPNLRLRTASIAVADAAVLSDPSRNPLAYHALSSALLVRAVRLLGAAAPASARTAARRALWALVALADSEADITWMGRGQGLVWSYGATVYAALAGSAEFARNGALAARLRRLADLATAELERRRGAAGVALTRGARSTLAGVHRSADTVVYNGARARVPAPGRR